MSENLALRKTKVIIGDKNYLFSELTIGDILEFRQWIVQNEEEKANRKKAKLIQTAKDAGVLDASFVKDSASELTDDQIDKRMETKEGMNYLAFLSFKRNQPEIPYEDFVNLIALSKMPEIMRALYPKSALKETDEKKTTDLNGIPQ